jgi:hypothetical protein
MVAALLPLSILEIAVVELLVPWFFVRLVVLAVSVYWVLVALGMLAVMRVRPHLVDAARLRLRSVTLSEVEVPLQHVSDVRVERFSLGGGDVRLDDKALSVTVMGSAQVHIVFEQPVRTSGAVVADVESVRFAADDPGAGRRALLEAGRPPAAATVRGRHG